MSNLYKFFSMCLCVITVGAVLCCSGNKVFANITLSEDPGQVVGYRTMVVKFDDKSDITKMNMALHDVFESIKKHSGNAMCPYDTLRIMFVHSFENATANTCFLGNPGAMISKICGIFIVIASEFSKIRTKAKSLKTIKYFLSSICLMSGLIFLMLSR